MPASASAEPARAAQPLLTLAAMHKHRLALTISATNADSLGGAEARRRLVARAR